jgi:prepilin-type N-terminal cleavage/methylation domain-containing protein
MQLMRSRLRADRADDGGFTLIELMIVLAILALVMGVLFNTLWQTQKAEVYTRGRTEALDGMRTALNRMTKDLRQTYSINGLPTATQLDVNTYVQGTRARVVYDMSGGTLTRTEDGGAPVVIQSGLTNASIFNYTADVPNLVEIVFALKPSNLPDTTLTLEAEIRFRNLQNSS